MTGMTRCGKHSAAIAILTLAMLGLTSFAVAQTEYSGLRITKTPDQKIVSAGQAVTWSIVVYNYGPDDANDVIVEDPMPAGLAYNGAATSQGGATFAGNKMTAYLGTIPRQSSAAISLFSTVTNAGVINNVATVASDTLDSEPGDDIATGTVAASVPDFTGAFRSVTQRCTAQRCNVRGTFDVGNIGLAAGATTVKFYLSDDALFQPETDTEIAKANAGSVRPGQSRPVRFSARLDANASGKFIVGIANPDGAQPEADMVNNRGVIIVP